VKLAFAGAVFGSSEESIEGQTVEVFSLEPDGLNLGRVVDVSKRIGAEKNQVGAFTRGNLAEVIAASEKFGRADSGGLQRGQGREAGFDEQRKIIVQAEAWEAKRVHGVGAGEERNAGAKHESYHLFVGIEEAAVEFEFLRRPAAESKIILRLPAVAHLPAHIRKAGI